MTRKDSFQLASAPSYISFDAPGHPVVSLMGIMDPNDQPAGELIRLNETENDTTRMISGIRRPAYFEATELSGDQLTDYVVCAFGNYTGALSAYENLGNNTFRKHELKSLPGARKVVVHDLDHNGKNDIIALMSQNNEQILIFYNLNNFNFRVVTLLRFPPIYRSSYFDVADFNHDGAFDILYTNGDNADYSPILKPYHGVRLFLNDGKNEFKESWFYPMHGASAAVARDFDRDGDVDMAAISFFPDFTHAPEQGFIYFENDGKNFLPHVTALSTTGRWIAIEANDIDHDGDCDIVLGALDFNTGVPFEVLEYWGISQHALLVMRNTKVTPSTSASR